MRVRQRVVNGHRTKKGNFNSTCVVECVDAAGLIGLISRGERGIAGAKAKKKVGEGGPLGTHSITTPPHPPTQLCPPCHSPP